MTTKVFILFKDKLPASKNFDDAYDGFTQRGFEVIPFEAHQIYTLGNTKEDICVAGIPLMKIIWKDLGVTPPTQFDIPDELQQFAKRKIWTEPFNDVRNRFLTGQPEPVFIKPLKVDKLFTGIVVNSIQDLMYIKDLAADTMLLCSEVINIVSEYRVYVNFRDRIIDAWRYKGDYRVIPDYTVADEIIKTWSDKPIAYSVDLGITDKGETVLVELNDSYALGNYGVPVTSYTKMLENRWYEIVGLKENIRFN